MVLLYASESWVTYRKQVNKLEAFHICSLQRMMSLTWQNRVLHGHILQRTNTTSIEAMIVQRRLRWAGHVIRIWEDRLPKAENLRRDVVEWVALRNGIKIH